MGGGYGGWRVQGVEVEGLCGMVDGGGLEKMNNGWRMQGWRVCKVKAV